MKAKRVKIVVITFRAQTPKNSAKARAAEKHLGPLTLADEYFCALLSFLPSMGNIRLNGLCVTRDLQRGTEKGQLNEKESEKRASLVYIRLEAAAAVPSLEE